MINNKNNLNLRKLIFFNFLSIIFLSFPIYAPLLIIGNGINISLKYQTYFKSAQELPNISAIDQLQIYFARILYHKAPYRNILQTNKNSWHGFPDPLNLPKNVYRKSLVTYYYENNMEIKKELYKTNWK